MISMKNIFILYKRNLVNPEVIYFKKKGRMNSISKKN